MLPDLPGWDSLSAVTRYHNWAEMAGIAAVAFLVIAELVSYQYGQRKDALTEQQQTATDQRHDEEMARLHLETAKANERAAELKLALEKEVAARQPRTITPEQRSTLLSCLADKPKGPVTVIPKTFDNEAEVYAAKIVEVLQEAGFEIRPNTGPRPFGFSEPGIFAVFNNAAAPPRHAGEIQFCLKQIGVQLGGGANPDWVKDPDLFLIAVSQKP